MKLVRFTDPLGGHPEINPDEVVEVRPARPELGDHPDAKTVIVLENGFQAVLESEDEVAAKLVSG